MLSYVGVFLAVFLVVTARKTPQFEIMPVVMHTVVRFTTISYNDNEPHECPPVVGA